MRRFAKFGDTLETSLLSVNIEMFFGENEANDTTREGIGLLS